MNEVLKTTLSLSCSGALMIAIIRLLLLLFQAQLSKQWQYYIWLVVAARLLVPFALETNLMGTLFQGIGTRIAQSEYALFSGQDETSMTVPLNDAARKIQDDFSKEQPQGETRMGALQNERAEIWIWNHLWLFWMVTALVLLIRKITIYQSFVKYIRAGCVEVADINLLERLGKLAGQSKVKTPMELYVNSLISSPLLIGFFRPCIVLPTDKLPDTEFQYIVLHELIHYRRRDMFYKWLIQITVCIHWFNPIVRLMSREVERTCELACDEAIIKRLDVQERRAYGDTLLNVAENRGTYKNTVASVTLGESGEQLRERLDAITGFQNKSKSVRFAAAALTAAVCLGSAAAGAYAASPSAHEAIPPAKPVTIGALSLTEKEYTMNELKMMGITQLTIVTHSDHVSVSRGGDILKFEYYALDPDEYVFQAVKDYYDNSYLLFISRSASDVGNGRSMTITIPEHFQFNSLRVTTTSGNISLTDCTAGSIVTDTQNGQINIQGGFVSEYLHVNTQTGDAFIVGTSLPDSKKNSSNDSLFGTVGGTIIFQPPDTAKRYCLIVDYGEEAEVFINNESISAIDMLDNDDAEMIASPDGTVPGMKMEYIKKPVFTLNESAPKRIRFHSLKGTLIVQEQ